MPATNTQEAKIAATGQGNPQWVACHDTLVCYGAKQNQKWCVRVGDERGPLIAVMLTKDVAHMLAAAPDLVKALQAVVLKHSGMIVSPEMKNAVAVLARATGAAP